eukprot:SAG11_NODE_37726_length_255_cov_1.282051_1_plen_47_part_00
MRETRCEKFRRERGMQKDEFIQRGERRGKRHPQRERESENDECRER